jgi:amylosucrase
MPVPSPATLHLAERSLGRLLPRLEAQYADYAAAHPKEWSAFCTRLQAHFPRLFDILLEIYGEQYDFFFHLEGLLSALAKSWQERPDSLKQLDAQREADTSWFQSNQMLGGVCYVDLFAGDLAGIRAQIPYFKELGLTYLHLMPLFKAPEGENDGGYAISSYREVDPRLGSFGDLSSLAAELRANGISLVVDFVFNHTSNEHEWALRARQGDPEYREFYYMFPDRSLPDLYEKTLREIFPDEHPGAFTYFSDIQQWVWTTFHSYQWDLNYQNPALFNGMVEEMLSLANAGVEVLRLDAVAFIWKAMGTDCENRPEAHRLIQAFNATARIAAPALLFKSEAIVHPDEVSRYIDPNECQISYNPLLMALLWESLATRDVGLLAASMRRRFQIPQECAWVNYVRCHDDIGWTFSDEDAASLWINGYNHRKFLNSFYTGRFAGSFARGLPFQENPKTGDCRISGTCASLAGLEKALTEETDKEVEMALRRILLIHGITLLTGGIPLIYLGDEVATLNDYSFRDQPAKMRDSRWVHRPCADQQSYAYRHNPTTVEGRLYAGLRRLITIRKMHPVFSGHDFQVIETENKRIYGFVRTYQGKRALVFANFGEDAIALPSNLLRMYGLGYEFLELISGEKADLTDIHLDGYQMAIYLNE